MKVERINTVSTVLLFSAPTIQILFDIWRATSAVYLLTYLLLWFNLLFVNKD